MIFIYIPRVKAACWDCERGTYESNEGGGAYCACDEGERCQDPFTTSTTVSGGTDVFPLNCGPDAARRTDLCLDENRLREFYLDCQACDEVMFRDIDCKNYGDYKCEDGKCVPNVPKNDTDGDGIVNWQDNCPSINNPSQEDTDNDKIGDACDACSLDPENDKDTDSICGNIDNCPSIANPDQNDSEPYVQTGCFFKTCGPFGNDCCDPIIWLSTKDSVGDACDNCPDEFNPNQKDTDSDGIGDFCDNCFLPNSDQSDKDHDGVGDPCENFAFTYFIEAEYPNGICSLSDLAFINDTSTDRFIVNIEQKCNANITEIKSLIITLNGKNYSGKPGSDIFITDKNQRYYAWITSSPRFQLHGAKKTAEDLNHLFDYEIIADGTYSPPQEFDYTITAKGREQYTDYKTIIFKDGKKKEGKLKKKCSTEIFTTNAPLGYKFTAYREIDKDTRGDHKINEPQLISGNTIFSVETKVCSKGLWRDGWVWLTYSLDAEDKLTRDWSHSQSGYGGFVVNGEEQKAIANYTHGFGTGNRDTISDSIELTNYIPKSSNSNVQLSMRNYATGKISVNSSGELTSITTYSEPWQDSTNGNGTIKSTEGSKSIIKFDARAPEGNTQYAAKISVNCDECPHPAVYYDINGDGIIEAGQFIAWMDGFEQGGPVSNILFTAISTSAPKGIIDSIKPPNISIFGENTNFTGHGEPRQDIIDYWWQSHKDGRISSEALFTTDLLSPANPHLINFFVKSRTGLWSPTGPNSTAQIIVNKPPTAFINYIKGMTDDSGDLVAISNEPVELNGYGFDIDGYIQNYRWIIDGKAVGNEAVSTFTFSGDSLGTHTITFRVQDNKGTWSKNISRIITVKKYPILLIHDYLRSPSEMDDMKKALKKEGYEVFNVDLREPVDFGVNLIIPLEDPSLETAAYVYTVLGQLRALYQDIKELKAISGSTTENIIDAKGKVKKSITDLRTTLQLISYKTQDQPALQEAISTIVDKLQGIERLLNDNKINDILTLIKSDNFVEDTWKILIDNYKFHMKVVLNEEFKITDLSIPLPVPERVKLILRALIEAEAIHIPGQATIFSKDFTYTKGDITASTGFDLIVKDITPEFVGDGIQLKGSFYISEIAFELDPGLNLNEVQLYSEPLGTPSGVIDGGISSSFVIPAPQTLTATQCSPSDFPEIFSYTDKKNQNLLGALKSISHEFQELGVSMTPELLAAVLGTLRKEVGPANSFLPVEEGSDYGMGSGCTYKINGKCRSRPYRAGVDYKGRGYIQITHKDNYEKYCGSDCVGTSTPETNVCGCKNRKNCSVTDSSTCPMVKAMTPERAGKIFAEFYYNEKYGSSGNLVGYANSRNYWYVGKVVNGGDEYANDYKEIANSFFDLLNNNKEKTDNLISCLSADSQNSTLEEGGGSGGAAGSGGYAISLGNPPPSYPYLKVNLKLSSSLLKIKLANHDIKGSAESVGEKVDEIKKKTGINKVDLVGSGMGGMAARYYTNYGYRDDVRKVVFIGSALHGSDLILWGPRVAKFLIDSLAAQAPALGQILGEVAKAAIDIILGEAAKQMEPHSSFVESLNLNGKDTGPEWLLWEWPGGDDVLNKNIQYYTIAGIGPTVGGIPLLLTLIHMHAEDPIIGLEVSFPFVWIGDLFTSTISAGLDNAKNKEVEGFSTLHWWLAGNDETIDKTLSFLDEPKGGGGQAQPEPLEYSVSNETLNSTAYQIIGPFIDKVNATMQNMHYIALDPLAKETVFRLHYKDRDAMWNPALRDYETCQNTLDLFLVKPDKTLVNPSSAALRTNGTVVYMIDSPDVGKWTLLVNGTNVGCKKTDGENVYNQTEYTLFVMYKTYLRLVVSTGNFSYEPNANVTILAIVQYNGSVLPKANVTAFILPFRNFSLNETPVDQITLFDDGNHKDLKANDGIYGNIYSNTALEDTYLASFVASIDLSLIGMGSVIVNRSAEAVFFVELLPELTLDESDISFSILSPNHGDTVAIRADIHNLGKGNATNAKIEFREGDKLIGFDVINITGLQNKTATIFWNATFGNHKISAIISPFNSFQEKNYFNNNASKQFFVGDNKAPVADAGHDQIARVGMPVFFDASKSSDNAGIIKYEWDTNIADPGSIKLSGVYTSIQSYNKSGNYTVKLTVFDGAGNAGTDTFQVIVIEDYDIKEPVAYANDPQEVFIRQPVKFSAERSSDNYGIASYTWDIDTYRDSDLDGIPDNDVDLITKNPVLEKGYFVPGVYTVKLTVDDVAGNGPVSDYTKVIVRDPAPYICVGDKDCDGIFNKKDNCPETYNPSQEDYDKDGVGDKCWCDTMISGHLNVEGAISASKPGDVICLITNRFGSINIKKSNITLDCLGHSIIGNGSGNGIALGSDVNDVIVKHCQLTNHYNGLTVSGNRNRFLKNIITTNKGNGIDISGTNGEIYDNEVCGNILQDIKMTGGYFGDDNSCNKTSNWKDIGSQGCTFGCVPCTTPQNNMIVTTNTLLCPGEYELPNGISIASSGITLRCDGAVLRGSLSQDSVGVGVNGFDNVKISGCEIREYATGIQVANSKNTEIFENKLLKNTDGIVIKNVSGSRINMNRIMSNLRYGLNASLSLNNNFTFNIFSVNEKSSMILENSGSNFIGYNSLSQGLQISGGTRNTILKNDISFNNGDGVKVINNADNIEFVENEIHHSLDGFVIETDGNTFINNSLYYLETGYLMNGITGNYIRGGKIENVDIGIDMLHVTKSQILGINASDAALKSIRLINSSNIIINNNFLKTISLENSFFNNISYNYGNIELYNSSSNILSNNTASENVFGFLIDTGVKNIIASNNISHNEVGIIILASLENIVKNNNIINNTIGIYIDESSGNLIFNNKFINEQNALDSGLNFWNTSRKFGINIVGGIFLGGNFWQDYQGQDTNGDDLGDTLLPYIANRNITRGGDYLPLVMPRRIVFLRGDSNADGKVDISDPINTLNFLFLGTGKLECKDAADANDDNKTDISDAVYTLNYLFSNGGIIKPPYPDIGIDPTADDLGCVFYNVSKVGGASGGGGGSTETVKDALNETRNNKTMDNQTKSFVVNYLESIPKGTLSITTSPSSAYVYIDGYYKGLTPRNITNITAGNYTLRLTKYGYQDYKTTLKIEQGKLTKLSPILLQQLSTTPSPSQSPTTSSTPYY